jgi:Holliday junction resolvase RusA-like endonuclease
MTREYSIRLPVPPSINRMYRVFRGRVFMVKEGKDYKEAVGEAIRAKYGANMKPLVGPVAVEFTVYRPAKRGDLDNFMKCLLDGMQGTMYKNDKQIVCIIAKR